MYSMNRCEWGFQRTSFQFAYSYLQPQLLVSYLKLCWVPESAKRQVWYLL